MIRLFLFVWLMIPSAGPIQKCKWSAYNSPMPLLFLIVLFFTYTSLACFTKNQILMSSRYISYRERVFNLVSLPMAALTLFYLPDSRRVFPPLQNRDEKTGFHYNLVTWGRKTQRAVWFQAKNSGLELLRVAVQALPWAEGFRTDRLLLL